MTNRRNKSGFSLIEALFASAILVAIIVPAMLTFRTHLASVSRMQSCLDAEVKLYSLAAETERAVLFTAEDYPAGAVTLSGPVHTVLSKPETTKTGPAELVRYDLSAKTEDGAISREAILYAIRPATNSCEASKQPLYGKTTTNVDTENGDDGEGKMNNEKESSVDLSALLPDEIKCVSIVAPASHASSKSIAACVLALEKAGKKVKVLPGVWKHLPNGADRARQIEQAWKDPETDLILCARGGSGSYDTLRALDFDILKSRNVPFMGFSNVSTLLCGFVKMGVGRPIGGPSASSLATYPHTDEAIRRVHDVLAKAPLPPAQLTVRRAPVATVTGKPLGGHLPSFASMKRDDGLLPDMTNRIVFVEYNKSYSYTSATNVFRLAKDRGWFNGAAALVLCDMGIREGGKKEQLREHITESVSCPVFSGYDYGHIKGLLAIDYERELSITPSGLLTWSD